MRLPRGIPAASLKHILHAVLDLDNLLSSAGNTRGLIEASWMAASSSCTLCLPRGIPAASLKLGLRPHLDDAVVRLPRGIPAASLKPAGNPLTGGIRLSSSAGNTRGLIEACYPESHATGRVCLPRGIPAASLKRGWYTGRKQDLGERLPRGIPAASLKRMLGLDRLFEDVTVFRGEYPRPH